MLLCGSAQFPSPFSALSSISPIEFDFSGRISIKPISEQKALQTMMLIFGWGDILAMEEVNEPVQSMLPTLSNIKLTLELGYYFITHLF